MNNSSQDEKKDRRRIKKIFLLLITTIITGTVLVVETYAWFVGITTVSVNQFTVTVSTEKGLELSLDANTWQESTLTVTEAAVTTNLTTYTNKKNKWSNALSPISSSGEMDGTNNVMKIFGKGSLVSTAGGYKLVSSQITNYNSSSHVPDEKDGYIVFDLFIRNGEGDQYTDADDEAIYLTTDSQVVITPTGTNPDGNPDYGLENSVRVAFAKIGRIASSGATAAAAQAITCSSAGGLCSDQARIWEPNDTAHKAKLITYYNQACKNKTGETSYGSNACTTLGTVSGTSVTGSVAVQTYTVGKAISASNNVDIYDGLNGYTSSVGATNFLRLTDTFTDTEKNQSGDARLAFLLLRANSITKVRIYIYLEGQDVDNYDLITKGKKMSVKFGLTKNKFGLTT